MHTENPRHQIQAELHRLVGDALQISPELLDVHAHLLDLGATSLALVDAVRRIDETFGIRLSVRKVFDQYPTLDKITDYVHHILETQPRTTTLSAAPEGTGGLGVGRTPAFKRLSLDEAQQQILFLSQYSEGASLAHNEVTIVALTGPLDTDALQRAFEEVVRRHDALRASVSPDGSQLEIPPERPIALVRVDLADPSATGVSPKLGTWLADEGRRAFDLRKSLFRANLLRIAPASHLLVLTAHALIADRRSMDLVVREITTLCGAEQAGSAAPLPPPLPLDTYNALVARHRETAEFQKAEAYWLGLCQEGVPRFDLPSDHPRPPVKSYRGARVVAPLDPALLRALEAWSAKHGGTLFMTLLTAFGVLIHRLTSQDNLVVATFGHGAPVLSGSEALVANAANPLPLRMRIARPGDPASDPDTTLPELLGAMRQVVLDAIDHQDYPFASLVRKLDPERDQSRSFLFTVVFDSALLPKLPAMEGVRLEWLTAPIQHTRYDLQLTLVEAGRGNMQLQCDFATDLLDEATVRRWLGHYKTILESIPTHAASPLGALPWMTEAERKQIVIDWNQTASAEDDTVIHRLFEAQVERTPDAVAAICGDARLTYRELNQRANRLAHRLRALGVRPEVRVGLCAGRSLDLLTAILGILKAGGAYVPLDPDYPRERLAYMLTDAGARVLLTEERLRGSLPSTDNVLCLDTDRAVLFDGSDQNPTGEASVRQLAYVAYTSGSTGKPKGVAVEHRSVVAMIRWALEIFTREELARVLGSTSICFDPSVYELFVPLSAGGALVLVHNALALASAPAAEEVTLINTVPSAIADLLRTDDIPRSVCTINLFGEALRGELVQQLYQSRPDTLRRVFNLYGPTEDTVYSTCAELARGDTRPPPIGRPISNGQAYVLDARRSPVPVGVTGELFLGGHGVARGYLNQPELTCERFVPDPFRAEPGARLYRTGDLARYRADGSIEFLGRADFQVKVHGFRIELGEVESALGQHPGVRQSVATVREDRPGDKQLVAYIVPSRTPAPGAGELRSFLKERLPAHSLPTAFVILDALPLTLNGKVNRRALPTPDGANRARLERPYEAPRNPTEELLAKLWAELMDVERIGVDDDFFALGGHSLLINTMLVRLRKRFSVQLTIQEFFAAPTVAGLARTIAAHHARPAEKVNRRVHTTESPIARARYSYLSAEAELAPDLVPSSTAWTPKPAPDLVLLTGATGFVGAYLLAELLEQSNARLACIVRSASPEEGRARLTRALERHGLWKPSYHDRIVPIPGDIGKPRLGLGELEFRRLAREVDTVIHNAAHVNFLYPFEMLKMDNVLSVQEIVRFALEDRLKPVHHVSTAAIWPMGAHRTFREDMSIDHGVILNMGYDESKWVAEKLLLRAREHLGLPLTIYRPGEVAGHSGTGHCATDHMMSAIFKGCTELQSFPRVNCLVDMSPVDYVAKAIAYLSLRSASAGRIFHITNPQPFPSEEMLRLLRDIGFELEDDTYDDWRNKLLMSEHLTRNALYPYAALIEEFDEVNFQLPVYDSTEASRALEGSGIVCHPADRVLVARYMDGFYRSGYIMPPAGAPSASAIVARMRAPNALPLDEHGTIA